jgi:hypothetical protein
MVEVDSSRFVNKLRLCDIFPKKQNVYEEDHQGKYVSSLVVTARSELLEVERLRGLTFSRADILVTLLRR